MQRFHHYLSILFLAFALQACAITDNSSARTDTWRLVYQNDADGNTLSGSKQLLIDAVRNGKQFRIFYQHGPIEHSAEVIFLSIWQDEVFAQIMEIQSQAPHLDPTRIEFRKPGEKWRAIIGSNGYFTAVIDGTTPGKRTRGAKWFIQD